MEDIHTYYAETQPTLVHNCSGGEGLPSPAEAGRKIQDGPRTGSAAKHEDNHHRAGSFVTDEIAEKGTVFPLDGRSDAEHFIVQMPGGVDGSSGRFEWVYNGGNVTHQLYVRNGKIHGETNIP